jgi:hypothetical protein
MVSLLYYNSFILSLSLPRFLSLIYRNCSFGWLSAHEELYHLLQTYNLTRDQVRIGLLCHVLYHMRTMITLTVMKYA